MEKLTKYYDLTNRKGIKEAYNMICSNSIILSLTKYLIDILFKNNNEKQVELAKELIKEGKKQGLKTLDIDIKCNRGLKIDIPETNINISFGSDEICRIHTEYNNTANH